MKRVLAALLSVIMVFSSISISSFASGEEEDAGLSFSLRDNTLTLPSSLKTIESEAFYGNTSISSVVVPYGCESIGCQAFAFSGLAEIYIPSTVTYIADNAFDGAPDVIIYTQEGAYAQDYADLHDFLWEFYKERSAVYGMMEVMDELELDEEVESIYLDFDSEPISTEGIEDSELLDSIIKYNQSLSTLQEMEEEFNAALNGLMNELSIISGEVENSSFTSNDDDSFTIECDDFSYSISGIELPELTEDVKILSSSTSQTGNGVRFELECNGTIYFLDVNETGFEISSGVNSRAIATLKSRGAAITTSNDGGGVPSILSQVKDTAIYIRDHWNILLNNVDKMSKMIKEELEKADLKLIIKKNIHDAKERVLNNATIQYEAAIRRNDINIQDYKTRFEDALIDYSKAKDEYSMATDIHRLKSVALEKINDIIKMLEKINPFAAAWSIIQDIDHIVKLIEIKSHGHPNSMDQPDQMELINKMNGNIDIAITTLVVDGLSNGADLIADLDIVLCLFEKSFGGLAGWVISSLQHLGIKKLQKSVKNFLVKWARKKIQLDGINGVVSDFYYEEVMKAHDQLHSAIGGQVFSEDTGEPLAHVKVTCGNRTTYTNSQGFYSITCGVGEQILTFTKQGYNMKEFAVNVSATSPRKMPPIYMPSRGTVAGYVKDAVTGKALIGVTVTYGYYETTTNSEGFYEFVLPLGTGDMTFSKDGYITGECKKVPSEVNKTTVIDMVLSKELDGDQFRVVLTWGASPADLDSHLLGPGYHISYSNKTAAGAALDLDDTSSYGPETTTFTINNTETYKFYVHDYSNKGNASSTALGRSGATVTIYNGTNAIAIVHVPSGTGNYWNVFQIVSGEFRLINTIGNTVN